MKKLLVITGAGASIDFGMPSVNAIDTLFEEWALEILPLENDKSKSLYSWVKEKLTNYAFQNSKNRMNAIINFESLLFTIQNLSAISRDVDWQKYNHRLNAFINIDELPMVSRFGRVKNADGDDFYFLQSYLIDKLLDHMRKKCQTLKDDKPDELRSLRKFYDDLKTKFDIGFINLNYDNVVLSAIPELKTGFNPNTGYFDRNLFYQHDWNFCYHVHGSVHFDMRSNGNTEMHKISWEDDLYSEFSQNSSGRGSSFTTEGLAHPNSAIIAGLDKTNQILKEPFGPYFMRLDQLIHEADAILFLGYGFSDLHLNKLFPSIRYNTSKIRKVVVVDFADDKEDGLCRRHDGWSFGVNTTLPYNSYEMGDGKSSLGFPVTHYKSNHILEVSTNPQYPLGVWYNGLMEACQHSDVILKGLI